MKAQRLKQIIDAAAKLPPAKGRALIAALSISAKDPLPRDPLAEAETYFEAAMINAAINALEESQEL